MKTLLTNMVIACAMSLGLPALVSAQTTPAAMSPEDVEALVAADTRTEVELGAALCVNEATWEVRDCEVLMHIRLRAARQRGLSFRGALVLLHGDRATTRDGSRKLTASLRSDRATSPRENDPRPWIGALRASGVRPVHFPEDGSWEGRYRARYLELIDAVTGVLAGTRADPCRGQRPSIWGGPHVDAGVLERKFAQGWRRSDCGPTRNIYLHMGDGNSAPNAPTPPRVREEAAREPDQPVIGPRG